MFGLGFTEILVILVIALIALGPKRLPEASRWLGKTIGGLRRTMDDLKHEMDIGDITRENLSLRASDIMLDETCEQEETKKEDE